MRLRALVRDRSGATAVEFALVLWPFCLMLLGSVEVARLLWVQQAMNKTAISAARCIGIRSPNCALNGVFDRGLAVTYVQHEARGWGLGLPSSDIAITDASDCDGSPGFSKVTVTMEFLTPVPFLAEMLTGSATHVSAKACFPTQVSS